MRSGTIKKIPVRGVFFSALICGCYWGLHTSFCNTHIIFHPHVGHTSVYVYIYIYVLWKSHAYLNTKLLRAIINRCLLCMYIYMYVYLNT